MSVLYQFPNALTETKEAVILGSFLQQFMGVRVVFHGGLKVVLGQSEEVGEAFTPDVSRPPVAFRRHRQQARENISTCYFSQRKQRSK